MWNIWKWIFSQSGSLICQKFHDLHLFIWLYIFCQFSGWFVNWRSINYHCPTVSEFMSFDISFMCLAPKMGHRSSGGALTQPRWWASSQLGRHSTNKYTLWCDKAEQSFEQFVTALCTTLLPTITVTYYSFKHEAPEHYLKQLELQNQARPVGRFCYSTTPEGGSSLGRQIHWPANQLAQVLWTLPISLQWPTEQRTTAQLLAELYGRNRSWNWPSSASCGRSSFYIA